jgi:hypothetical protein
MSVMRGKRGKSVFGSPKPAKSGPHFQTSASWIECAPVSYFVQGLRCENFRLRRGSTKQATNAVILDSRSSNPSPERSDGPTG